MSVKFIGFIGIKHVINTYCNHHFTGNSQQKLGLQLLEYRKFFKCLNGQFKPNIDKRNLSNTNFLQI